MTAPRFEPTSQRQKVSMLSTEPPGRPVEEELDDVGWLGRLHSLWAAEFSDTKNCSTIRIATSRRVADSEASMADVNCV